VKLAGGLMLSRCSRPPWCPW